MLILFKHYSDSDLVTTCEVVTCVYLLTTFVSVKSVYGRGAGAVPNLNINIRDLTLVHNSKHNPNTHPYPYSVRSSESCNASTS